MSAHTIIMTQGKFMHRDSLTFPFEERGLQFGDGVYEVIRIYKGKYYLLEEHIDRLYKSLAATQINISLSKADLSYLLDELLLKNNIINDAHVYLQVTRGSAERVHLYPEDTKPNIYGYVKNTPRPLKNLTNGVAAITYPDERWKNCYIKSLNLLPNILAKQNAFEQGAHEAILHKDNLVTECSTSNVFLVKNNAIYTHPANNSILHGCVRSAVKRFAANLDIPFNETTFKLDDINNADEIFLTNSMDEIMPIVKVDNNIINTGHPGSITKQLQIAYQMDAKI